MCEIIVEDGRVKGVKIIIGVIFLVKVVVFVMGIFFGGKVIIGEIVYDSGFDGMYLVRYFIENFKKFGIEMMRFKIGMFVCVYRRFLDFLKM